jgi:hypothetical protein
LERIEGNLPTSIEIIRTVAGLSLPVRCSIVQGGAVGSCSYTDLCRGIVDNEYVFNITPSNCPLGFSDWGIDCNCPFKFDPRTVDREFNFDLPDLSYTVINFLANGDMDMKVSINNAQNQHIACFRFLFTMMKA